MLATVTAVVASDVVDLESAIMPASKPKLYKVTYAGRVEVDTNSLVYSKEGQRIMAHADKKICSVSAGSPRGKNSETQEHERK